MWKTIASAVKLQKTFLNASELMHQQLRTTFILKRTNPPMLHKKGREPRKLRTKNYIYELVEDTTLKRQPDIEVILKTYVEGLGNPGEKVFVHPNYAYNKLLLPGLAVYASPENEEKYKDLESKVEQVRYSSPNVMFTIKALSNLTLSVVLNKENPWTLKPWHIKSSFRKSGFLVPEEAITLPEKPISGPDMALEDKEFFITVTINNQEKVNVRCRIHHWSTNVVDRLPYVPNFWESPSEPIIPEQASVLESMPKKVTRKETAANA